MTRSAVISWRVAPERREALSSAARRNDLSTSELLERITDAWLASQAERDLETATAEERVRQRALRAVGAFGGGDPDRTAKARAELRARIVARVGKDETATPTGKKPRASRRAR